MKVRFSQIEHFLEELRIEVEAKSVTRDIVRVTCVYQRAHDAPHISSVTVVAGFLVKGKLVELQRACGLVVDFPNDQESAKTRERAQEAMTQVHTAAEELGLSSLTPPSPPATLSPGRVHGFKEKERDEFMGQFKMPVRLLNAREVALARLGHLAAERIHAYEAQALIDPGATRCVIPPFVATQLELIALGSTSAPYADGRLEDVPLSEALMVEILGRQMITSAMIIGQEILLGAIVFEELDLWVDCKGQRLIPNPAHPDQPVFRV